MGFDLLIGTMNFELCSLNLVLVAVLETVAYRNQVT